MPRTNLAVELIIATPLPVSRITERKQRLGHFTSGRFQEVRTQPTLATSTVAADSCEPGASVEKSGSSFITLATIIGTLAPPVHQDL
jgi:hypothetical protein